MLHVLVEWEIEGWLTDMAHVILHPHLSEEDSFTKTDHKLVVSLGRPSLGRLHGGWVKFDFYVERSSVNILTVSSNLAILKKHWNPRILSEITDGCVQTGCLAQDNIRRQQRWSRKRQGGSGWERVVTRGESWVLADLPKCESAMCLVPKTFLTWYVGHTLNKSRWNVGLQMNC